MGDLTQPDSHDHFERDADIDVGLLDFALSAQFLLSESWQSIRWQAGQLAEIRNRAISLFSLGSVAVAFLGSTYLDAAPVDSRVVAAIALYGALGAAVAIVLWPSRWSVTPHPSSLLAALKAGADELPWGVLQLVKNSHEAWHNNENRIARRTQLLQVAVVLLVIQIGAWLLLLATM